MSRLQNTEQSREEILWEQTLYGGCSPTPDSIQNDPSTQRPSSRQGFVAVSAVHMPTLQNTLWCHKFPPPLGTSPSSLKQKIALLRHYLGLWQYCR